MLDNLTLAGLLAAVWLLFALSFSRHAVWLLLLWIPIQGWIQLNLLEDSSVTVLIYEFQVVGLYLVFGVRALHSPRRFSPPSILWFAVPFLLWALALIPHSLAMNGLLVTLLGLRSYLLPLPLVWIGYRAFENRRQLENVGSALMVQLPLVAVVTTRQLLSLTTTTGEVYDLPSGFMLSGVIRPPGTFSAPGQLGVYLLLSIPLAIGLLGVNAKVWKRTLFLVGLISATVALMANTQRTTIVLLVVTLPITLLLARRLGGMANAAIAAAVVGAVIFAGSQVISVAFRERVLSISENVEDALVVIPAEHFRDALRTPWVGRGLGIASPGALRLTVPMGTQATTLAPRIGYSESFIVALVYQTGVPGLLLFSLLIGALMRFGLKAVRECRRTDLALLAAAIFGFELAIVLQSWTYGPLHYPPARVLFWFWAGVLLNLPRLAAKRALHEQVPVKRMAAVPVRQLARPPLPSTARVMR